MPRLSLLLLGAGALAVGCERDTGVLPVVGTLERDRVELVAESNQTIVEIPALEGAQLHRGDVILRLDSTEHAARADQTRAQLRRAEQRLAELERGPRPERIADARARVDGAREDLAALSREYERVAALLDRDLASPSDLDRAYSRRELARAEYRRAGAVLDELLDGTTAEELGQAEAAVDEAAARLAEIETAAARLDVIAPRDGRLDALPYELGERPPAGATVAVMLAGPVYARVYIPEPIRAAVTPGLEARVRVDGSTRSYAARVRYVASEAAFTPYYALTQRDRSRLSYLAEITLDDPAAGALPTGVPVEVDFPSLSANEP